MGYRRFRRPRPFVARRWSLADVYLYYLFYLCYLLYITSPPYSEQRANEHRSPVAGRRSDSGFGTPRLRDSELPEDGRRVAIDDQRTVIVARRLWLAGVNPPLCLLTYLNYLLTLSGQNAHFETKYGPLRLTKHEQRATGRLSPLADRRSAVGDWRSAIGDGWSAMGDRRSATGNRRLSLVFPVFVSRYRRMLFVARCSWCCSVIH